MRFGIYVHFPYCRSKCRYCDFFSMTTPVPHDDYALAIDQEFRLRKEHWVGRQASSLYLGGGTPSLWDPAPMERVLSKISTLVHFSSDPEWTLEANPGTVDARRLHAFRALGFNRLSLGVQSFDDVLLRAFGRIHSGQDALFALETARDAGFGNLSLDLIYGLPGQTLKGALTDVSRALELAVDHLSVYELMVKELETKTPLALDVEQGTLTLPEEEEVFEMGHAIAEHAHAARLERYEISSFARAGHASRHNQLYWTGGEYLGLGCGAVGFSLLDPEHPSRGGRRWTNFRDPARYFSALRQGQLPEVSSEPLDAATLFEEWFALGLRQCAGVDLSEAIQRFEIPSEKIDSIRARAQPLVKAGWVACEGDHIRLTSHGLDLHTELVVRLIG